MVKSYRPSNLGEALDIRAKNSVVLFAGGTDLMVAHRGYTGTGLKLEKDFLFLDCVEEMLQVREESNTLIIGAAVPVADIIRIKNLPTVLKQALELLAAPGIRNRATLGGNIGNASPAGDSIPPLYVLDAKLKLVSQEGERLIPIEDFFLGVRKTVLQENEIVTEIHIPLWNGNRIFYRKVGTRKANALSKLSVAGLATVENNKIEDFRIAFGAVSPVIVRKRELENKLKGMTVSEINVDDVLKEYESFITPINDQRSTADYRFHTSLNLLKRFLKELKGEKE